jgi:adenosylcobyric acid synthase
MTASVLMVQGTMSSVGKSLLVAGLCRVYARRGVRVAPYKAQNMSNNAAVCADGAEIGRAQYTQALACGLAPTAQMNPILLKPEADSRSQVVVMGEAWRTLPARGYYEYKDELWGVVTGALADLRAEYDLVIIEGAGSAAELNLRDGEIVNMAVARHAQAPVLLAGDIDRGGIFAQLLGTLWLLDDEERALVKGLIVNKFRGDLRLFADGVRMIEERGGVPVVGVVPYLYHDLPEEDAVAIERQNTPQAGQAAGIDVAVIRLPRISNFDDFDPLAAEPGVSVRYAGSVEELGAPDAVIIPGTKSTMADLDWLRAGGLADAIAGHAARGGAVVGICGGYQMLGRVIRDPDHTESPVDEADGLALLPVETTFQGEKATHQARATVRGSSGWLAAVTGGAVTGYEIHMGRTHGPDGAAWLEIDRRGGAETSVADGAIGPDARVWGCYLHGLFENDGLRRAWLGSLGWQGAADGLTPSERLSASFDRLADALEDALDMPQIDALIGL